MLAVYDYQFSGEGSNHLGAAGRAVEGAPQAARGARLAREHYLFAALGEDRRRAHVAQHRVPRGSSVSAKTKVERSEQERLAGPRLTRDHVETRTELQARVLDDAETVSVEFQQLRLRHVPLAGFREDETPGRNCG